MNILGIVVVIDGDSPRISDLSRKNLIPIAVEGVPVETSKEQHFSGRTSAENGISVKQGDCVILRGFTVWFETKTGLPRLCKKGTVSSRAGTCSIWKGEDKFSAEADPTISIYERQKVEELRRWWTEDMCRE